MVVFESDISGHDLGDARSRPVGFIRSCIYFSNEMPEGKDDSDIGPEGLLSLEGRILVFLDGIGRFRGSKAELARRVGGEASQVHKKLDELEDKKLIRQLPDGYELTRAGIRRIRLFRISRIPFVAGIVISIYLVVVGIANVSFGVPVDSEGLVYTGVAFIAVFVFFWYYYSTSLKRLLKGKKKASIA